MARRAIVCLLSLPCATAALLGGLFKKNYGGMCVMGEEEIMCKKAHGTSATPVQQDLRWQCAPQIADK